jgi:hypothetical protein
MLRLEDGGCLSEVVPMNPPLRFEVALDDLARPLQLEPGTFRLGVSRQALHELAQAFPERDAIEVHGIALEVDLHSRRP